MNYKVIKDEEAFRKFIDWLPDTNGDEQFYYALFSRKKYDVTRTLKADKAQVARGTATKDRLYDKIKKLEVLLGTYKIGNVEIPENTLALYITPNPRCMRKASLKTAKMILDNIDKGIVRNPKAIALDAVQVSKSRTVFVDFDFDIRNSDFDRHIFDILVEATGNEHCFDIIRTKGGYHTLVRPSQTINKNWHQNISINKSIDQSGDLLLPMVGCVQGDFVPKFI